MRLCSSLLTTCAADYSSTTVARSSKLSFASLPAVPRSRLLHRSSSFSCLPSRLVNNQLLPRDGHLNMPTVRDLRCTINTRAGAMIEYIPPPEGLSDSTTPCLPDTPNTHTRYVNITGCENERLHIKLNGTDEFRWSEALCMKLTADFYIDGVLVGNRPYYEHYEDGRPPSIVFGAVKKIEVEIAGGDYREVEKKASLTFKEVAFAEQRLPNDAIPLPATTDPLGEIMVKVYRSCGGSLVQQYQHGFQHRNTGWVVPAMASERMLMERDVKGRGIQYLIGTNQFQEAPQRPPSRQPMYQGGHSREQLVTRRIDMQVVDPYNRPYVCFRFLYRTRAHLEGLGLIPSADKESIHRGFPYKILPAGGVKRKREDESPLGPSTIQLERGGEHIPISDSDDDDLVVLEETPRVFKRKKISSLFKLTSWQEKGRKKEDPEKESLFLPFESRTPSPAPPTPLPTLNTQIEQPDFRIVYKEDSDGLFVAIREPVTPKKRLIYTEGEAGNFEETNLGADLKPVPMGIGQEVKAVIHPPVPDSVSGIKNAPVNSPMVSAGSTSEPKSQSTVFQNHEQDFIAFDEEDDLTLFF